MRKINLQISINVYKSAGELEKSIQFLLQQAQSFAQKAYAPYSGFKVGASVLLSNGKDCGGANFENAAYPMCLCAERAALANAHSLYPEAKIEAIAIRVIGSAQPKEPVAPCGACRQALCETEDLHRRPIKIYMQGENGEVYELPSARSLLPLAFSGQFLKI